MSFVYWSIIYYYNQCRFLPIYLTKAFFKCNYSQIICTFSCLKNLVIINFNIIGLISLCIKYWKNILKLIILVTYSKQIQTSAIRANFQLNKLENYCIKHGSESAWKLCFNVFKNTPLLFVIAIQIFHDELHQLDSWAI